MSEIVSDHENEISENLQSAIVSNINVNGTRLDRILVVGPTSINSENDACIPVEEIEIELPLEFEKFISIDCTSQISKVCRTCLCEKAEMHSLFENWENETIAEMLSSFIEMQLSFGDGLPESLCGECTELVTKCFSFKQLCERSESMLRCLLTQGHLQAIKATSPIEEEEPMREEDGEIKQNENTNTESYTNQDVHYEDNVHYDKAESSPDNVKSEEQNCGIIQEPSLTNPDRTLINQQFFKRLSISINPSIDIKPSKKNKNKKRHKNKTLESMKTNADNLLDFLTQPSENYTEDIKIKEEIDDCNNHSDNSIGFPEDMKIIDSAEFQCEKCGKNFSSQRKLKRHEKTHLEIKPYQCGICKKGFLEAGNWRRHERKHTHPKVKGDDGIKEEDEGSAERKVPCPHCHLTFSSHSDLTIHSSVHLTFEGKRLCHHCNKEFDTMLQLKRHVRTHLSDKPYKCRVCHKGFPEMGSLTRHFRRHTGETRERKHVCKFCQKGYHDRHTLKIHERKHTGERPWVCSECGRSFTDSRLLNSHMKIHSDIKPYACKLCDKRFKHDSTLTTHIRTHTGEKPYVCTVCGNAFVQSSNLALHMRTHTRERPYCCDYCSKKFSSSSAMTIHKRTHTGEKPFTCRICQRRFARHDMKAHMRTHTGEKPFTCSACNKGFTTLGQLNQHTRIHTGEKPYVCQVCRKGCSSSSYLKKHLLRTHNVDPFSNGFIVNTSSSSPLETSDTKKLTKEKKSLVRKEDENIASNADDSIVAQREAVNIGSTLTLTSNTLNVVAVATSNGEVSILRQQNDLNVTTLTGQSGDNISTIVTNTLVSQEKLYQIDSSLLKIGTKGETDES